MSITAVALPTPVQEGMIYQSLVANDPRLYNEQLTLTLHGTLDSALFQQSVDLLVLNHSVLRSSYVHEGVTRSQAVILRERGIGVQWIDLTGLDVDEQETRLLSIRDELQCRPFDFVKEPLLRFTVCSVAPDESVVVLGFHHIILDGWSLSILLKELLDTYSRLARGEEQVTINDDFSIYLNRLQELPEAGARAFWQEHLSGLPVQGDLPVRSRAQVGDRRDIQEMAKSLTPELTRAIYKTAAELGVTPNAFHQALLAVVLMKSQRMDDIVFGVVNSGRQALGQKAEHAVGMFINTVPLRARVEENTTFLDVVRQQHRLFFAAQAHSHLSLPEIKRLAGYSEEPFRVLFTYENYPLDTAVADGLSGGKLSVSSIEMREITNYDLSVTVFPGQQERLRVTYNAEVYAPETVEAFLDHYAWVAQQAVDAPNCEVRHLRLAVDDVALGVDALVNATHHTEFPDITLIDAFDRILVEYADFPAVTYLDHTLSYADLDRRARLIAGILEARGVARGDHVALLLGRSFDQIAAILAVLRLGAVYVPLDPQAPLPRLRLILEDARPSVILTTDDLDERLRDYEHLEVRLSYDCPEYTGNSRCHPQDPAYIIYTSGSTGHPKGVTVTHANVVSLLLNSETPFAFGTRDVWTLFHSYAFDFSVWEIWGALLFGGRLVVVPSEVTQESRLFHELVVQEGVTVLSQTPGSFYLFCAADADADYPECRLHTVVLGGEALAPARIQRWQSNRPHVRVVNMYGITETTVHVTWFDVTAENTRDGASIVGRPLPTLKVKVVDCGLNVVPVGIPGEILVSGAGVSLGYHGNPQLTSERFIELPNESGRWYRSGDLAVVRTDGMIEYRGRIDNQVQVRGFRVELGEIEARLISSPEVAAVAVTSRPTDSGAILVAHVVPSISESIDHVRLREYAAEGLPGYMVPNFFHVLEKMPLNVNDKVDRRALAAWEIPTEDQEIKPLSPTEAAVAQIWAQSLDRAHVGVGVDFFSLGGHSLLLMRIVAAIEREFGVRLGVRDFLASPTVRGVASAVDVQLDAGQVGELFRAEPEPENREAEFPLTDIQVSYALGRNSALELGGVSTHLYLEIETELDIDRIDQALTSVIARHPMLTVCIQHNGRQHFTNLPPRSYLTRVDLTEVDDQTLKQFFVETRERMSHQIFPLGEAPMFEFVAVRLDDRRHTLCISLDPLIADAGSMRIVSDELMTFYNDPAAQLPELKFTFRDYVLALQRLRESEAWDADRRFWQERVHDFPEAPALPTLCDIATIETPRFTRRQHRVSPKQWTALKEYAAQLGVGPTALLLDLYAEALHPYTGQDKFALNLTVANRVPVHPDVDNLVGDFTSLMLIAIDRTQDVSNNQRLHAVQEVLNEALEHRLYDGVDFVRDLAKARGAQNQAIMPVVFTAALEQGDARRGWDALGRTTMGVNQTSQVILDNQVVEIGGGLDVAWDYVEDLFDAALVAEMFDRYVSLLENPAAKRNYATAMPGYNDTDLDLPVACMHDLFLAASERAPGAPAVRHHEVVVTYAELQAAARRWAAFLVGQGVQHGDRVGVLGHRSIETVAVLLATQFLGAAYVPMDPSLPSERISFIVDHSRCAVVIDSKQTYDLPEVGLVSMPDVDLDDESYVIYTSGSTGHPKGVVVTHRQATNTILAVNQHFAIGPDDRVLGISSLGFDLSVYDVFGSLAAGACLVISGDPRDVKELVNTVESAQITVWNSVPAILDLAVSRLEVESESARPGLRMCRPAPAQLQHPIEVFATQDAHYSGIRDERIMFDRAASEKFKHAAVQRNRVYTGRVLHLPYSDRLAAPLRNRQSWREFDPAPIPLSSLVDVLGVLRQFEDTGVARYTYASAGGLYPIDVYLHVKAGRVEGLAGGSYYYNPMAHTLEIVSEEDWDESIHLYGNTDIFISSAVTVSLVYDSAASFPKYGSMGYFQACLDAGIMTELITRACEAVAIGTCSIGNLNWEKLREQLRLDTHQVPLHVLELGSKSADTPTTESDIILFEAQREAIGRMSSLRLVMLSGDWIPVGLPARLRVFNNETQLYSLGGATEGAIWSIWYPIEHVDPAWSAIPYGRPMPNQRMYVLDTRGRECPLDVAGEIHIGGTGVAVGYDADPEETAAAFIEHPALGRLYRTGDYGVMGRDGVIHFLGRRDQQVKIQGMRIELGEIDAQTLAIANVTAAKTIVRQDGEGIVLACYYVGTAAPAQVREHLAARLPRYMLPGFVVRLDDLPLSSNGKVDVKALSAQELGRQPVELDTLPAHEQLASMSPIDSNDHFVQELLSIWRSVLGRDTLQLDDNFFDAGGDSTMLIRSHALLDAAYPDAVSMIEIFSHPSVRDLAQLLRERVSTPGSAKTSAPTTTERRVVVTSKESIPAGSGSALAVFCTREMVSRETAVLAATALLDAKLRESAQVEIALDEGEGVRVLAVDVAGAPDFAGLCAIVSRASRMPLSQSAVPPTALLFSAEGGAEPVAAEVTFFVTNATDGSFEIEAISEPSIFSQSLLDGLLGELSAILTSYLGESA